jgi:hypothetical protein
MLAADPIHRPTIAKVHATLMAVRVTPDAPAAPAAPSRLRGKGLRRRRRRLPVQAAGDPPVDSSASCSPRITRSASAP